MVANLWTRMLLKDSVHSYLHRIERNWCGADRLSFRELETTCLENLVGTKTMSTIMSRRKHVWRMAHASEDPDVKSTRERCIRVAAIVIVITAGPWNICIAEKRKKPRVFSH